MQQESPQKRTFWVARFARIYPLYLVALIVAFPILVKGVLEHSVALPLAIQSVVLSPILLQAWSPNAAVTWNMAAWTLSAEALFYILFPFLLGPLARLSQRVLVTGGVALLVTAGGVAVAQAQYAPSFVWQEAVTHLPAVRILEFVIGVILGIGFVVHGWRVPGRSAGFLLALAAVLLCIVPGLAPKNLIGNALLIPLFALLILALANGTGWTGRILSTRTAVLLGESSYAVYLLHLPLYQYYNRAADLVAPTFAVSLAGVFLFTIALVFVAIFAYRYIEVPARRQIRTVWKAHEDRKAVTPRLLLLPKGPIAASPTALHD
ncbi:acyltransferase [Cryobacterium sp. TMT4-10]|uniref:acyltransferase family protein n=1 Tax=Cryobacterium sp. TMT4-10 TaxID=1259256 RepID=UPI00106A1A9B|nr:acyltransferase [Cryobacterium sp. TMT4-10]TFD21996.1 acyltransferase [Cryobacterium sp. TMT4-10]